MKHLLLFAVSLLAVAGLWVTLRNGPIKHLSVSLHVARAKVTQVVFGLATFAAATLMGVQFFGWLLPHYDANIFAYFVFGLVVFNFVVVALVPHIEGTWRSRVHNLAAWGLVCEIPPTIALTLLWQLNTPAYWSSVLALGVTCGLLILMIVRKSLKRWFLYFQIAYLAVFFVSLLTITYC